MKDAERAARAEYDLGSPFLLAPGGVRLIELQPTLRCNLRCAHCYSESGPDRRGELSLASLAGFLIAAADLGYSYVGVSGGEPLLWGELEEFLAFAHGLGLSTSVTTNGTLLGPARAARLRGLADLVAVSVDGPPAEHAAMRGSERAFPAMQRGLAALREARVPFSLAFTLTRHNADQLSWLHEFADAEGALGINVHPLCAYGAARVNLADAIPDSLEFQVAAWLLALKVQLRGPGGPAVTLDAMRRSVIETSHWPLLTPARFATTPARFADLVPALIVEPDGCITPFIYGFPRPWAVGWLEREPLPVAAERWRNECAARVSELVCSTLSRLTASGAEFVDLFGEVLAAAHA